VSDFHVERVRRINVGLTTEAVLRPRFAPIGRTVFFTAEVCDKCPDVLRCHRERRCWRSVEAAMKMGRRA
jgi:hypothetical protein